MEIAPKIKRNYVKKTKEQKLERLVRLKQAQAIRAELIAKLEQKLTS